MRFPKIYKKLLEISRELVYEKRWNPQEIEFTFEGPEPEELYLLQTRDMITIKKKEHLNVFVESAGSGHMPIWVKGVGVSGSALSGRAVFTEENIRKLRKNGSQIPHLFSFDRILYRKISRWSVSLTDFSPPVADRHPMPLWWPSGWRRPVSLVVAA